MGTRFFLILILLLSNVFLFAVDQIDIYDDFSIFLKNGDQIVQLGDFVGEFVFSDYGLENELWIYTDNYIEYVDNSPQKKSIKFFFKIKEGYWPSCIHSYKIDRIISQTNDFSYPRGVKMGDTKDSIKKLYLESPIETDDLLEYKIIFGGKLLNYCNEISYRFEDEKLVEISWRRNW